jgi:hypothetical protein
MVKIHLIQPSVLHKEIVLRQEGVFAIPITLDKIVMFHFVQMLAVTIPHVMEQIQELVFLHTIAHVFSLLRELIALSALLDTLEKFV